MSGCLRTEEFAMSSVSQTVFFNDTMFAFVHKVLIKHLANSLINYCSVSSLKFVL